MKLLNLLTTSMMFIGSVFSLPLIPVLPSRPETLITDKYTIDFNGASGGFKLISNSDNTFYNMRYGWLTETPLNKLRLDFQNFNYGSNENKTFVDTELTSGLFQIQIKNDLWKINDEYINEKNQTIQVDKDVMKITIFMKGWNFLNLNNDLTLDFIISNNIGSPISNIDNSTIRMRDFDFSFEKTAMVDGVERQVNFYTLGNKYHLTFPSFTQDLFYDPSISYVKNNSSYFKPDLYFVLMLMLIISFI
jgi:hypothetical protein